MVDRGSDQWREMITREAFICLPTELLFFEKATVPAAVELNELTEFVELTLEERSPFPLRELCFGYLYEPTERCVLIYAAIRRRVEQLFPGALEEARFVLPAFCLLNGMQSLAGKTIALQTDTVAEMITMTAQGLPLPLEEAGSEAVPAVRLQLHSLEWAKDGALQVVLSEVSGDEESDPEPATHPGRLSLRTLWAADVREDDFKKLERARRKREKLLLRAIVAGGWAALFLLVSQFGLWAYRGHVERLFEERTRLQTAVLTVQDRHGLLTTLEQVTAADLRPMDVLEAMNRLRPDAIHFTEMRAEGQNRITIEGIASSVNLLNRYAESLRESGEFRVSDPRTLVRAGRTTFTLTVDYTGPLPVLPTTARSQP